MALPDIGWLITNRMYGNPVNVMVLTTIDNDEGTGPIEVESAIIWAGDNACFVKLFDDPENHLQVNGEFVPLGGNVSGTTEEISDFVFDVLDHLSSVEYDVQILDEKMERPLPEFKG